MADGAEFASDTVTVTESNHTVSPDASLVPSDYTAVDVAPVTVTLYEDGSVEPQTVTFTYQKPQTPTAANVTFRFVDEKGSEIQQSLVVSLENGTYGEADLAEYRAEIKGYTYQGVSAGQVVSQDGKASPDTVTFSYKQKTTATLEVRYVDAIGEQVMGFPEYIELPKGTTTVALMFEALYHEDLNEMLRLLQAYLLTVPQCDNTNYEGHYQQLLYVIFSLLGRYVDVEVRTATGRVDMVLRTARKLYLFELKLNRSAEAAMQQIDLKEYPARFALCGLPVVKIGINFDAATHTISDWEIVE